MQYVGAVSHKFGIAVSTIVTLPVHDRSLKHIAELSLCSKEVWPDEIHHAPVLEQVVL